MNWIIIFFSFVVGLVGTLRLRPNKPVQTQESPKPTSQQNQVLLNHKYLPPPAPIVKEILDKMFPDFETAPELIGKGGFSQSGVYMVQRCKGSTEYIPAAVKIAPAYLIEKEKSAYRDYIDERLLHASKLNDIVYSKNNKWAGLQYEWVGKDVREVKNLYDYLNSDKIDLRAMGMTLKFLLNDYYKNRFWKNPKSCDDFSVKDSYDRVLPVNLAIIPVGVPSKEKVLVLSPYTIEKHRFKLRKGMYVRLIGFQVTAINPYETEAEETEFTLNFPAFEGGQNSCSFRVRSISKTSSTYKPVVGQNIPVITGRVENTRSSFLQNRAQEALIVNNSHIDLNESKIRLIWSGQTAKLPNPLLALPKILDKSIPVKLTPIHGDLHLDNIQVDMETHDVVFIDFADARNDHVLHDLLRLETSLVTRWLAHIMEQNSMPASAIFPLYRRLHWTTIRSKSVCYNKLHPALRKPFAALRKIRMAAREYQVNEANYHEYYNGLTVYLLGALKFNELNTFSHELTFWGAATSQYLLSIRNKSPQCNDIFSEMISPQGHSKKANFGRSDRLNHNL